MPITVRHDAGDGDLSTLTGLAALAGLMQAKAPQAPTVTPQGAPRLIGRGGGGSMFASIDKAEALKSQREMQVREIDAKAQMQKQAADESMKKVAIQHGLDREMQEIATNDEVRKMQEKAKMEANQFTWKFGQGEKQKISQYNNNKRAIAAALAEGRISQGDADAANRQNELKLGGVELAAFPNENPYPPGKGPADIWIDEKLGGAVGLDRSGNARMLVAPKDMPENIEKQKMLDHQLEMESERAKQMLEMRLKLATEPIQTGTGENRTVGYRSSQQIDEIMQKIIGGQPGEQSPQEEWWEKEHNRNLAIHEEDKALPPQIGHAAAYVRTIQRKGGFKALPPEKRAAYFAAVDLLKQFANQ